MVHVKDFAEQMRREVFMGGDELQFGESSL